MATLQVGDFELEMNYARSEHHMYMLIVRFEDEGTKDGHRKIVKQSFYSLLEDVDPDDVNPEILSKNMRSHVKWDGAEPVPHCREDVTFGLIQLAVDKFVESYDFDGELTNVRSVEVEERTTIRETPYNDATKL